jgi:hypothetical protein
LEMLDTLRQQSHNSSKICGMSVEDSRWVVDSSVTRTAATYLVPSE